MRQFLRPIVQRVRNTSFYAWMISFGDRIVFLVATLGMATDDRRYHLLLAAPGEGNIGDQAMLEAYVENINGAVVILMADPKALVVPESERWRTQVLSVPRLVSGLPGVRTRDVWRFSRALRGAKTFTVTGADVMDGRYNTSNSLARVSLLHLAEQAAVPNAVMGFSWAPDAAQSTTRALRRSRSTRLFARDPRSESRLREAGMQHVIAAADSVFSSAATASPQDLESWATRAERPFMILNVSGLIAKRQDLTVDYGAIVRHAHGLGYRVLVVPHVIRSSDDDLVAGSTVFDRFCDTDDLIVKRALRPAEVRYLTNYASYVVTGRMHLAIMSLGQATPVLTLSTQGKVEGLYDLFELKHGAIEPRPGFAELAIEYINRILNEREEVVTHIRASLPVVRQRSKENFRWITETDRRGEGERG